MSGPTEGGFSPDERKLLDLLTERLTEGRKIYGPLQIAGDPRDFTQEAAEELLDCAIYLAIRVLRERGKAEGG